MKVRKKQQSNREIFNSGGLLFSSGEHLVSIRDESNFKEL
jgi:hypothetical protein